MKNSGYSLIWVYVSPLRMMQLKLRAENFAELSNLEIERRALALFRSEHDPKKPRAWGMLLSEDEEGSCLRIVCSRSASNNNQVDGLFHSCESHLTHDCLINKDGLIQSSLENNLAQIIPVREFLKLRAIFRNCSSSGEDESIKLLEHLKHRYPGRHICFSKGLI
jgi:hypothetical protein